jgi:hypothetical protein
MIEVTKDDLPYLNQLTFGISDPPPLTIPYVVTMTDPTPQTQAEATASFLSIFTSPEIGGQIHSSLESRNDKITGLSMFSKSPISADERLITCPASWVITPEKCREAIGGLCKGKGKEIDGAEWKETMLICGYICLHWIYHDRGK